MPSNGASPPAVRGSPPSWPHIQRTAPSFSASSNVQVEYSSTPPSRRAGHTSAIMRLWRSAHISTTSGDHSRTACGSLRNIPSPEHGTSARIMSKHPVILPSAAGAAEVTFTCGSPHRVTLSSSTAALRRTTSLAVRENASPYAMRMEAAMSVVLPPGAAHRSSAFTRPSGNTSASACLNTCPTNIADESCT